MQCKAPEFALVVHPPNLARSVCAVLDTDTPRYCTSGAAFLLAHYLAAAAVLFAPASSFDCSGALVERADLFGGAMFSAEPSSLSNGCAAFGTARHCLAVVFRALPSRTDGAGNARVRCAVSIGAVLEADKPANDLQGLAVWIGAGQLHRVLAAHAAFLRRGGGATSSQTRRSAVMVAEPSAFDFVRAFTHRAHLLLLPSPTLLFLTLSQQL